MTTDYGLQCLADERLRELRAAAMAAALARQVAHEHVPSRPGLRSVVGQWLIRLGTRLTGAPAAA